jgi:hypothetical protein
MATSNLRIPSMKHAQRGSAGGLVVLVVLAFLVWWQWD